MSNAKRPLIPLDKFPEQLRKFLSPDSPLAATRIIVQGLVPMSGPIKICALYQAVHLHKELEKDAKSSLVQIQTDEFSSDLKSLPPPIIDWVAELSFNDPARATAVFACPQSAVSTIMRLLSSANERTATQLADNQVKLMSNTIYLQSLCLNPALPSPIRNKLIELAQFQDVDLSWLARSPFATASQASGTQIRDSSSAFNPPEANMALSQSLSNNQTEQHNSAQQSLPNLSTHKDVSVNQLAQQSFGYSTQAGKKSNSFALVGEEGRAPEASRLSQNGLSLGIFPPQIQKFLAPDAPEKVLQLIFGGLVPMPSNLRVLALYHLAVTRPSVKTRSINAVRTIDLASLKSAIENCNYSEALDWLADVCLGAAASPIYPALDDHADLISTLTSNSYAHEQTIARLALYTSAQGCERIALNQQRILEQASIIHALYYNPQFSTVQADRLLELAAREGVDLSWLPDANDVLSEINSQTKTSGSASDDLLQEAIRSGQDEDPKDAAINAVLQEHAARRATQQAQADEQDAKPKKAMLLFNL